jgi:hypothetical protein
MSVAGRIALPGERIDNGLDEGQLNGLGIGGIDLFRSARGEQR